MAQLELPAPVLTLIVSKLTDSHSSASWKTLRLVCKALCARAGYFAKQLRLEVDADLPRKARRCMERGFRADSLHLVSPTSSQAAQRDRSQDQTAVLLDLFHLPIWSHLRTLRLRGMDLPESVLLFLPQACPNLQELFLEGVLLDHSNCSTSRCDVCSFQRQCRSTPEHLQPQSQQEMDVAAILPAHELPAVAVGLPHQLHGHAYTVQLCCIAPHSITYSKHPPGETNSSSHTHGISSNSIAAARIALILSDFQRLRLLRMDCALAESVMHILCDIHQRLCLQDQRSRMCDLANGGSCTAQKPLLEYFPLLGWYLFNVTGPPSGISSACRSASSGETINSIEQQPSAVTVSAAVVAAESNPVGGVPGSPGVISARSSISSTQGGAVPSSSSSLPVGIINSSSSCPPSANNSSHQLVAINGSAAANQAVQQQQLQEAAHTYDESHDAVLGTCSFMPSQLQNNNAGLRNLDVNQQLHSRGSTPCKNTAGEAAATPCATDTASDSGSFAVSCCNLGHADGVVPGLCDCRLCSFCSEDGFEDACSMTDHCSTSTLTCGKVQQGNGMAVMLDVLKSAVSDAASDSDTGRVCSDQQL